MEGEEKNRLSFGLKKCDDKIKLIDMLTEDDDEFLVASHFQDPFSDDTRRSTGFRISGFEKRPRPSFYRKSIAWDSAFFDSPGVLDPAELSCINKGFKATEASHSQDVRERIPESESIPNNDDGFCGDCLEIEPTIHKPKPCKMPNRALKSVEIPARNESNARTRHGTLSSPKPLNASGRNIHTRSKVDFSRKSNAKMKSICTNRPVSNLFTKRNFDSALPPKSVADLTIGIAPNAQTPGHLKIKTQPVRSRIRGSLSASMIWRRGDRDISSPSIGRSDSISSSVDKKKLDSRGLKTDVGNKKTVGVLLACNSKKEAEHRQSPVSTPPNQYSRKYSVSSLWDRSFGISGLRRPSPQIGFFDENTSPISRYHDIARNRKLPKGGVLPEGSSTQKPKSLCSKLDKNIKRPKLDDHATNSSIVHQSLKPMKKKKATADQENRSEQPKNLSEYFATMDLNRENHSNSTTQQTRKRAPLADKTSSCNYPCTLGYGTDIF